MCANTTGRDQSGTRHRRLTLYGRKTGYPFFKSLVHDHGQEELLTSLKGRTLSAQQKKVILTATVSNFVEEAKASVEEDVESSIAILMSRLRLNSGGDVLSQTTHSTNAN